MENELKEILKQLKALTARVESMIETLEACDETVAPVSDEAPSEEVVPEATPAQVVTPAISFTLNDRFRFQRALFGNSAERMGNAITAISAMSTADEVYTYLTNVLDQDINDPDVDDFFRIVTLRFADHKPLIL